jgi:hypothetical protein
MARPLDLAREEERRAQMWGMSTFVPSVDGTVIVRPDEDQPDHDEILFVPDGTWDEDLIYLKVSPEKKMDGSSKVRDDLSRRLEELEPEGIEIEDLSLLAHNLRMTAFPLERTWKEKVDRRDGVEV